MASVDYEIRQRTFDKKWCIYLKSYNVVVAVFTDGCDLDAQKIKEYLECPKKSKKKDK